MEARHPEAMMADGFIDSIIGSAAGIIDPHADGTRDTTRAALAGLAEATVRKAFPRC